ncbi:hypothetical protein [Clostridium felsineum]|uniref:hypothetical protein n=1 Tax=Clostridium felsineum TaxID=36839 RepID=UPI0009C92775|nr:hypothetical protein [Clostridium felsineum]URZ03827.1 hypothetical protein CLAUR_038920 [Clostridium felsineum]
MTKEQIDVVVDYAKKLDFPKDKIFVADEVNTTNTSMMYDDILIINNDVYPLVNPPHNPNARISAKGTIAHEIVGHYETALKGTSFEQFDIIDRMPVRNVYNTALDEAQASIRAARFAPELTSSERYTLLRDGISRLKKANLNVRDVKDLLDIKQR